MDDRPIGTRGAVALAVSALLSVPSAQAVIISGRAVGSFSNALDGTGAGSYAYSNADTSTVARFEWGNYNPNQGESPNYFTFDGNGSDTGSPSGTTDLNNLFSMGTFVYHNAPTRQDKVTGVDFTVDMLINGATISSTGTDSASLVFQLGLMNTRDNSDPNASADTVYIRNMNDFAQPMQFTFEGLLYNFELAGFSRDGGKTFEMVAVSLENETTAAEIYGRISLAEVPAPGALGLMSGGLAVLAGLSRRRKKIPRS